MVLDILIGKVLDDRYEKSGKKDGVKKHYGNKKQELQEKYGKRCKNCNGIVESTWNHCPECGEEL